MTRAGRRTTGRIRAALLIAVTAVTAISSLPGLALVAAATPAQAVTRPTGPLTLATGAFLGAMTNPDRNTTDSTPPEVATLETTMGRKLAVVNRFYAYPELITGGRERQDLAEGRIPMITWGASDTLALTAGSQDTYLRRQARSIQAIGGTVFLRFYHEMDGGYRAPIVHSPAAFNAAWRHVHDLFAAEGVTNAVWVWCPTAWGFTSTSNPGPYYPGDDVVDWIASDGYNWAPSQPNSKWRTFKEVFARWYAWGATRSKPLLIAEFGVQEDPAVPGRKAQWLRDALASMRDDYPLVQGAVYFDTTVPKTGYTLDWNLASSPSSIGAWAQIGADPYLAPMLPAQAPGPGLPGPYEYVTNPGFGHDLNGWLGKVTPAKALISRDVAVGHAAPGSVLIRSSSPTAVSVGITDSPQWVVSTVAGQPYTGSIWVTASRPNQAVKITLRELRGGTIVSSVSAIRTITTAGAWKQAVLVLTPLQQDSFLSISVTAYLGSTDQAWADDASLVGP